MQRKASMHNYTITTSSGSNQPENMVYPHTLPTFRQIFLWICHFTQNNFHKNVCLLKLTSQTKAERSRNFRVFHEFCKNRKNKFPQDFSAKGKQPDFFTKSQVLHRISALKVIPAKNFCHTHYPPHHHSSTLPALFDDSLHFLLILPLVLLVQLCSEWVRRRVGVWFIEKTLYGRQYGGYVVCRTPTVL